MRYDFSPLYRSTVGFDRLLDVLDRSETIDQAANWPPHNVEKTGQDKYRVTLAVAGFTPDEIEIVQQDDVVLVSGRKGPESDGVEVLHRGIPTRPFRQTFRLADYVKVAAARLSDGLLTIDLVREVPEELKPRRIEIAGGSSPRDIPRSEPGEQIEQAKAA